MGACAPCGRDAPFRPFIARSAAFTIVESAVTEIYSTGNEFSFSSLADFTYTPDPQASVGAKFFVFSMSEDALVIKTTMSLPATAEVAWNAAEAPVLCPSYPVTGGPVDLLPLLSQVWDGATDTVALVVALVIPVLAAPIIHALPPMTLPPLTRLTVSSQSFVAILLPARIRGQNGVSVAAAPSSIKSDIVYTCGVVGPALPGPPYNAATTDGAIAAACSVLVPPRGVAIVAIAGYDDEMNPIAGGTSLTNSTYKNQYATASVAVQGTQAAYVVTHAIILAPAW